MSSPLPSAVSLFDRLAGESHSFHTDAVEELRLLLQERLQSTVQLHSFDEHSIHFMMDLSDIHLRGMHETHCLIVRDGLDSQQRIPQFFDKVAIPGSIPFLLTLSGDTYDQAIHHLPKERSLILSPEKTRKLFESLHPKVFIKQQLWEQIPKERLDPYDFLLCPKPNMFFGRQRELDMLCYDGNTSFAIAGPTRIGKSSLVKQYQYRMIREHDPCNDARFYIDLYECKAKTEDEIARFIAMRIAPSNRSNRMTLDDFQNFLHFLSKQANCPLDLILDEVDEVCKSEVFNRLGRAAKLGDCRLILCGRGLLLRAILNKESQLAQRVNLIHPCPLDDVSAQRIIEEPFQDLGFRIADIEAVTDYLFKLTGKLPHLLQYYCKRILSRALAEKMETITPGLVKSLKWDLDAVRYFLQPLDDLTGKESLDLALILLKNPCRDYSLEDIFEIANRNGVTLDIRYLYSLCDELVVNNILTWRDGTYRIVAEGLHFYVRELGYLNLISTC